MNTIARPISPEPITGFQRIARHENFVILADLNMVQQVRVVTLDQEGNPLLERIEADEATTAAQKQAIQQRYQDQLISKSTAGAFVNKSGQVVPADTEGAISQRDFFQAITLGDLKKMGLPVTDKTPVVSLIYALIGSEIGNIDVRGDL
jgi:hypothetical protein